MNMFGEGSTKIQVYVSRRMRAAIKKRAATLGFSSMSEYVRALIRADSVRAGYYGGEEGASV